MTLPENRKPEGLEKNEPVVIGGVTFERTGSRRLQALHDGKLLVIKSTSHIWTYEEDE